MARPINPRRLGADRGAPTRHLRRHRSPLRGRGDGELRLGASGGGGCILRCHV